MIKSEYRKDVVEALARTMEPQWEEKDKQILALLFVQLIESVIESNRAKTRYYNRRR